MSEPEPPSAESLRDRIAEAIPSTLTATPHVGVGGARRQKIANAVLPVVEEELQRLRTERDRMRHLLKTLVYTVDVLAALEIPDAPTEETDDE